MRLQRVFRLRLLIQRLIRALSHFTVTALVLTVLFGAVVVGKNILLGEVRKQILSSFRYESLRLTYFPPTLVVDGIQSLSAVPYFRARQVRIEVPYVSLLRKNRAILVSIEEPDVRLSPEAFPSGPDSERRRPFYSLPITIERGVVRNGDFFYRDEDGLLRVLEFHAFFTQKGDEFSLIAEAEEATFTPIADPRALGGRLSINLSGMGQDLEISHFSVEGQEIVFKGDGSLRNLGNPELDMETRFEVETAYAMAVLDLPFEWQGKVGGQGKIVRKDGETRFTAALEGNPLVLNGVSLGNVRGELLIDSDEGGRGTFEMRMPGRPPGSLSLTFRGGRVEGTGREIFLDPIMRELKLPWPVKSPVWGTFTLEDRVLEVNGEFRDSEPETEGGLYGLRGRVNVRHDFTSDELWISAPDLITSFAQLDGEMNFHIPEEWDATFRGNIADVKATREFLSLILDEPFTFPEIRGRGYADIHLTGNPEDAAVSAKLNLTSGGFHTFDAAYVEGDAVLDGRGLRGEFRVEDPYINGDVRIEVGSEATLIDIRNGEGDLVTLFTAMGIPPFLQGRAAGDFQVLAGEEEPEITGTFESAEVIAFGKTATDVRGSLDWKSERLTFPEIDFDFHGGHVQGRALLGFAVRDYDVDLRGENIDLASLGMDADGRLSFSLVGRGTFGENALGGRLLIQDLVASPLGETGVSGEIQLDYPGDRLDIDIEGGITPGDNAFSASLQVPLSGTAPFSGKVEGYFFNLNLFFPWRGVLGRLDYIADIGGGDASPGTVLSMEMEGPLLPIPGFAHALTDYSIAARLEENRMTITSLTGKLGDGTLQGSGEMGFGESGLETIDMRAEGRDMLLSPIERMRALVDGTARLLKDDRQFVLEGDLFIKQLSWRRELYERFGFSSASLYETKREPSFFDGLSLNLRLRADENALMDNSLGRMNGRFDLSVTGSLDAPVLLGDIDILSGDFYFQDRTFRVLNGRLSFFDPTTMDPYLDFQGETYVKNFRVTLDVNGPASRLRPELSSSPPLPPEEVLALLALGETFRRTHYSYSYDRSTTLSTASLLSFQIADQAKKRTEGIFTLDRFRIDPFIPEQASTEIAARITVGKKISRNLLLIYSTILANSTVLNQIEEEPIFRIEWDISNVFSLVGGRDDRGKLSFDVKFRKRF